MPRLLVLVFATFSGLALAAPRGQATGGGACCGLIILGLFVYIYRAGGADWLRSIGAAVFPGIFGWFIWRDRDLGTGSRWFALVHASLHIFSFVLGLVLTVLLRAGVFNSFLGISPAMGGPAVVSKPVDLSNVPEDPALGLHPVCTITSDPPGAKVFINGKERGKTPLDTPLAAGERNEVRVELDGYFPDTQSRSPNAREQLTFSFTLKAAARLEVKSEPPGARVVAGMKDVLPRTPGRTGPLEAGPTDVLVLLPGYQAHHQVMTLPTGDTSLEVTLTPGVKIAVTSTPDQADVLVDGVWLGQTPTSVFVSPKGKHTLEVKKETWAPAKKVFASLKKPFAFDAQLVDTRRVGAKQAVVKARARYDKVNQALEKLQAKLESMAAPPDKLERQRVSLERDMELSAGALEKAEAQLKAIEEERGVPPPQPEPD